MRKIVYVSLALVVLGGSLFSAGCDVEQAIQSLQNLAGNEQPETPDLVDLGSVDLSEKNSETITIASFNIQVFGISKSKKPEVMDVLAQVVRRFDVVAIQEVRSKDQSVVPRFVELINSDGARYDYILGPRLGRTSSKEQYVYIFDSSRIEVDRQVVYTLPDHSDALHREPLIARFRVLKSPREKAFTFTLINIHTDPDETDTELDVLDDAFSAVQRNGSGEDDVILLGDFNVDEHHFGELGRLPNIAWAISGVTTNTLGSKSYDNIVFDRSASNEYTGNSGVLSLHDEFGLTMDQALDVSDHLPVWAEFSAYEGGVSSLAAEESQSIIR